MEKNKTGKYFKYAIGEIVLVVIGILIALSINNWNQVRIQNNEVSKIHQRIIVDLDNDIRELSGSLMFWNESRPIFNKVINDSISTNLLDQGLSRLLVTIPKTNLNKSGVQQLKTLNIKDELSLKIIDTYDYMENIDIIPYENGLNSDSKELFDIFRDNYEWFPEWMSKTITKDNSSKELQNYFLTSTEYRNRIIDAHVEIFTNYLPRVEFYTSELEDIRTELKMKSDINFIAINKKELEKYEGSFKITKIEGESFGAKIDDTNKILMFDNFLRFIDISSSYFIADLFYKKENTFFGEIDGIKMTAFFEADNSGKIIGFKLMLESDKEKGTQYAAIQK